MSPTILWLGSGSGLELGPGLGLGIGLGRRNCPPVVLERLGVLAEPELVEPVAHVLA